MKRSPENRTRHSPSKIRKIFLALRTQTPSGVLLRLVSALVPQISRDHLLAEGLKNDSAAIVEESYICEIPKPEDPLTDRRFHHLIGKHKISPFFGIVLKDVRLIGPYGIPVTRSGKVVMEPIARRWFPNVLGVTLRELGLSRLALEYLFAVFPILDRSRTEIPFAAHLLCRGADWLSGRGPIFGHWLGEQIPQLRAIEKIQEKSGRKFALLINRKPASWQLESLALLGYNKSDILEHDKPGVRVRELVISSLRNVHSRGMELDPRARMWASERLRGAVNGDVTPGPQRIAYLRTNQPLRTAANIIDLRATLSETNFVEDKDYPNGLYDYLLASRNGKHIVAIAGSNVFHLLFCSKPESFVEIFPPGFEHREFCFLLSFELGMTYACVPALAVPRIEQQFTVWQGARDYDAVQDALYVPITELEEKLNQIG